MSRSFDDFRRETDEEFAQFLQKMGDYANTYEVTPPDSPGTPEPDSDSSQESDIMEPEPKKKFKLTHSHLANIGCVVAVAGIVMLILSLFKGMLPYSTGLICTSLGGVLGAVSFFKTDITIHEDRWGDKHTTKDVSACLRAIIPSAVALVMVVIIAIGAINVVPAGEADVVVSSPAGNNGEVYDQGWYFNPTFLMSKIDTIRYNTQTSEFIGGDDGEDLSGCITVMSKDGSTINIDISITYHIPVSNIKELRYTYGQDWEDTIINQAVRSIPRVICAEYDATDFISNNRAVIENALVIGLTNKISSYNMVIVDSVQIKEFRIPTAVTDAVQAKLIAEQEKAKALIEKETTETRAQAQATADLITAQNKADILVLEAKAKADAVAELQAQFTSEKEYLQYLYLQALTDPNSNVQYVVPNGSTIVIGA